MLQKNNRLNPRLEVLEGRTLPSIVGEFQGLGVISQPKAAQDQILVEVRLVLKETAPLALVEQGKPHPVDDLTGLVESLPRLPIIPASLVATGRST